MFGYWEAGSHVRIGLRDGPGSHVPRLYIIIICNILYGSCELSLTYMYIERDRERVRESE